MKRFLRDVAIAIPAVLVASVVVIVALEGGGLYLMLKDGR